MKILLASLIVSLLVAGCQLTPRENKNQPLTNREIAIQKVTNDIAITFVFSIFVDTIFFLPMGLINYILTKNRNG